MTAVVIGVGPGLGRSIAHRFGREGHPVALISRSDTRHAGYLAELSTAGVKAEAFTADVQDTDRLRSVLDDAAERLGPIDVAYYGPAALGDSIARLDTAAADDIRAAMKIFYPAVDVVHHVLPGMLDRGRGTLLFAGGLSSVRVMPQLGAVAIPSAAMRNYAITLNATLADTGVYAGTLTIGGLISRGDIYTLVKANEATWGPIATLDPDDIADSAWDLHAKRDRAEEIFNVID
ncbi:SDR family NAD(P)-dependent oxidoreductase [Kutzneria chonburiensis]|uniref:SDR family NAD(P)-dependent oxidoreductase n=1 Tax=Kutzneria chonburiensis TaxID=1483604 RepID=A0ABV6N3W7_9PSEU|nr:SDR family NAD(P)-dependent oxidoreductase [Kutzneria chonburiensis]